MIIAFGNYKGGVGKTTATELFSYILSTKMNYKVLAIDTDPQSNLSEILAKTFKINYIVANGGPRTCGRPSQRRRRCQSSPSIGSPTWSPPAACGGAAPLPPAPC